MMSQTELQIITQAYFPLSQEAKAVEILQQPKSLKFSQLIEYNDKDIFL